MSEEASTRHRHKDQRRESSAVSIGRKVGIELVGLLVVGLGLFLVFEQMNLRETAAVWFREMAGRLLSRSQQLGDNLDALIEQISPSDVVGFALIFGALALILLRVRWRLLNNSKLTAVICPKCGGSIHRTRRTGIDRLISAYVPVRRYRCNNATCRWHGLRVGAAHGVSRRRAAAPGGGE